MWKWREPDDNPRSICWATCAKLRPLREMSNFPTQTHSHVYPAVWTGWNYWKSLCTSRRSYDSCDDSHGFWNYYPITDHTPQRVQWISEPCVGQQTALPCTHTDLELVSSETLSSLARNCLSKGTSGWPDSEKTNRAEFRSSAIHPALFKNSSWDLQSNKEPSSSTTLRYNKKGHNILSGTTGTATVVHHVSGAGTASPTCCQHWRRVPVPVELQVLSDELVDEQVLVGERRASLTLVVQGAEHLRPDPSPQLAQHAAGLQRLPHGWNIQVVVGWQSWTSGVVNFGQTTLGAWAVLTFAQMSGRF